MKSGRSYVQRDYRDRHQGQDLKYFQVQIKQSDLAIGVDVDSYSDSLLNLCRNYLIKLRGELEDYIKLQPLFQTALLPIPLLKEAPEIARRMGRAAASARVGPMAAVAGTIAELMGEKLAQRCMEVIVENGGDIYIRSASTRYIGIFAGTSPFSNRLALQVEPHQTPLGICTSSGTVGPSLSLGCADAVVIVSPSAAIADAVATAAGNMVQCEDDLQAAVNFAMSIKSVTGALAIKNDKLAVAGNIKLAPM